MKTCCTRSTGYYHPIDSTSQPNWPKRTAVAGILFLTVVGATGGYFIGNEIYKISCPSTVPCENSESRERIISAGISLLSAITCGLALPVLGCSTAAVIYGITKLCGRKINARIINPA